MSDWLKIAMHRDVVVRGLKVGPVVGTILTAVNQGDLVLAGTLDASSAWKIPLTYLVPYFVSTYAGVSAIIAHDRADSSDALTGDE
jgi:hypothetical protein